MILSGYMTVAFISYIFSGAVDQSKLDLLGFGFPSFFFILIFFVAALNLFGYRGIRFFKTLVFTTVWMLWTSIALGLALTDTVGDEFLYVGGMYGFILSSLLTSLLGTIGAALILIFTLFVLLVVTFSQFLPWVTGMFAQKEKEPEISPKALFAFW